MDLSLGIANHFEDQTQGIFYHYSLFVYSTQDSFWVKAGDAASISPKQFYNANDFFHLMPAVYQVDNYNSLTDSFENEDLKTFLTIFEVYYDFIKTYAELGRDIYDVSKTPVYLMPSLLQQFGLRYEPELGLQQMRILLKNAALIAKKKGSITGIKDFVKAFTGWDSTVTATKNLMLNYNDSSFEDSVGSWANIAKATLAVATTPEVTPYENTTLTMDGFSNSQRGSLKVTASSAGNVEIACGLTNTKTRGIPVTPGVEYTFSIFSQSATTNRKITVDIRWYDRDLNEISRAGESFKTNSHGSGWSTRVSTTNGSPDDAWFAVPYVRIDSAANGEVHYFDAAQFEENSEGATEFEEARGIKVFLNANRINLISNPCFENSLTPWSITNGTGSIDGTLEETATGSANSAKIVYNSGSEITFKYDNFAKVMPEEWYTISGYVRTAFTGAFEDDYLGGFDIEWYDASGSLIYEDNANYVNLTEFYTVTSFYRSNNTLYVTTEELTSLIPGEEMRLVHFQFDTTDDNGDPISYDLDGTYTIIEVVQNEIQLQITGDNIPLTNSYDLVDTPYVQDLKLDFNRVFSTFFSPSNATYAKTTFKWTNPTAGQSIWLDSLLFERASAVNTYFDGSKGFSEPADLMWEDETNQSRSHYYKNRTAVEKRLIAELPNYIRIGTHFSLYFAQPNSI
jgi:hypothetical protein